jgi:hypothetical protein
MNVIKQEFRLPLVGVIFLASLAIVLIGHFAEVDFGIMGVLAWVVVIGGVVYFIWWIVAELFGR